MDLTQYIRDVPDFPKPGILFKDLTPLLANPEALRYAIDQLIDRYRDAPIDAIAAVEARGFLLATPLALALNKPLIPLRKPGKLPYRTHSIAYELEYSTAELHMHIDAIAPEASVLLVDDLLATGGTLTAGCQLVEKAGGKVHGCVCLVELLFLEGRKRLGDYDLFTLIQY